MNPFLNPVTVLPFLKGYLSDPGRLEKYSPQKMAKYRDKMFRNILQYAYNIPIYHDKYKKAGVHPSDIKGLKDITKLPFVTKKDMIENYPDNIIPKDYNKDEAGVISTSGSTGKPVTFYVDFPTTSKLISLIFRSARTYNYKVRDTKYVSIGNFSKGKADQVLDSSLISHSKSFWNYSDNYRKMNAFDEFKNIVEELDKFKPDYIISYPITYQQLAYFKKKGYGKNINPKILATSGYMLDGYTKKYVEDAFGCPVVDVYTAAESIGEMAFQCLKNTYHVNYDFFHLEAIDDDMNLVSEGESGHIVLTRLFGKGTPFIRYTGIDDWATIVQDYKCECGLHSPILKYGVEGRRSTSVVLPDGRVIPSASFAIVSLILKKLKTFKVTQFQIIQNKIDDVQILIVIDDDLRDKGPSVDLIFKKIKEAYEEKCGPKVKITVKEVKEIKSPPGKPLPLVVSKIKPEEGFKILEENKSKK